MSQIPTIQYAQVVEADGGPPIYKQIPVPTPADDQVLVNIKYSGVCHTDLHTMKGDWPLARPLPLIGGHEGAGIVVSKGRLVGDSISIGDYVGVKWLHSSCFECAYCLNSDEPLCPHATMSGCTVPGTFQQYCAANAAHVARLPKECAGSDGSGLARVAPILCAGITVYKGLKESGARPGHTVAIVGAGGGLGTLALQYAKAMGIHAIAIDGPDDEKRDLCTKELGALAYIDYSQYKSDKELVAAVRAQTTDGFGPHAAILLAVTERPFQQASQYVRSRGVVVCIGLPAEAQFKAPVFDTVVRMISIKGSYVGNRADTAEALDFYARGLVKANVKIVGLSELEKVYDLMERGKIAGRYVVDNDK